MPRPVRRNELHRRRARRRKLKLLQERYVKGKTQAERERILQKVTRVAPTVTREQFLSTLEAKG